MVKPVLAGSFGKLAASIYKKRSCENLFNLEPFFVFYTESVMLGARFIPSPYFIPSPWSVVRRPQSIFYTDRSADWLCLAGSEKKKKKQSIISNGDFFFLRNDFSLSTVNINLTWQFFIFDW